MEYIPGDPTTKKQDREVVQLLDELEAYGVFRSADPDHYRWSCLDAYQAERLLIELRRAIYRARRESKLPPTPEQRARAEAAVAEAIAAGVPRVKEKLAAWSYLDRLAAEQLIRRIESRTRWAK